MKSYVVRNLTTDKDGNSCFELPYISEPMRGTKGRKMPNRHHFNQEKIHFFTSHLLTQKYLHSKFLAFNRHQDLLEEKLLSGQHYQSSPLFDNNLIDHQIGQPKKRYKFNLTQNHNKIKKCVLH